MIGEITNHLWQSTVFAFAVALVAIAFRKNRAEVRYWLWLSASLKFLVPCSLLIGLGIRVWDSWSAGNSAAHIATPNVSTAMVEITQPFPETFGYVSNTPHANNWIPTVILTLWTLGFLCVALMRCRSWFRIRSAMRESVTINISSAIPVRSSAALMEPGVVGFLRPVLLLPEGILKKLTAPQLEAVLAHEQSHIRRHDNLTSAFHMIVEAIFWFHPIVWWIGAKLVEERERACDEAVLKLGNEPEVYAEGILNVCRSYLESPLRCVSGVTGSELKKRIRTILSQRVIHDLNFRKKAVLAIAGIAAFGLPVLVGMIGASSIRAQSQTRSAAPNTIEFKYDVASIKANKSSSAMVGMSASPDGLRVTGFTLQMLISMAYGVQGYQISGSPNWLNSERYDIEAKMDSSVAEAFQKLNREERLRATPRMMQALLADRFNLKAHRETKDLPVYALVIAKSGLKLKEATPGDPYPNGIKGPDGRGVAGSTEMRGKGGPLVGQAVPIDTLVRILAGQVDRTILDRTGLAGKYDFTLQWIPESQTIAGAQSGADGALPSDSSGPSLFTALQEQLGLKLEPGKGPVEVIVIDHIEKPSGN